MKKVLLLGLVGLICFGGFQAQGQAVGCNDTVRWGAPLSFMSNKCCWTVLEGPTDCFYASYNQIDCNYDTLADHRFLSPWVAVPSFAATDSVVLIYATQLSCTAEYSVAITTDGVNYDTLRHRLVDSYQYDTLYLGSYAGQVIRIQLCHYGLNSTFDPYAAGCSYAADYNWQLLFSGLQWRSLVYPVATWTVPAKAYVGETTWLRASLADGSHTGLTYTWHSSLMGQTLTGDTVGLTYTAAGLDTLTLVVSNAFGSDTLTQTVTVVDCGGVITAHPWLVDFSTDFDCWRNLGNADWGYSLGNNTLPLVYATGYSKHYILVSPAVQLPADSAGLRLYWRDKRYNISNQNYRVLVTTGEWDSLGGYDTVYQSTLGTSWTQRSVSLAAYAGQTVHIAFDVQRNNASGSLYLSEVKLYNSLVPLGTLEAPAFAATGDTVQCTVHLTQGADSTLTYSWHSSLLDTTFTSTDSVLNLVYTAPGSETLTVTVSNAYGTLTLSKSYNVYTCNVVNTYPWEEDFGDANGSYNVCWAIDGYSHNAPNSSYGAHDEETDVVRSLNNFMMGSTGSYMITPPLDIPAGETHMTFMVEFANQTMEIRVSPTASTDTAQFTDVLLIEPSASKIKRRWVNLGAYAGQTIRVAIVHPNAGIQYVNRVWVGLDTLPYIGTKVSVPAKVHGDSTALCTVSLYHGATDGLHYTWTSAVGGIITTNALGDSAWVNYSAGFSSTEDTLTVVVTNAFGADTVARPLHIIDCTPALTLPWKETFADGLVCWYKPDGSKWYDAIPNGQASQEHLCHLFLQARTDTLGSWIISKEIQIPADTTLAPRLFWNVASSNSNYQHLYSVLVTTAADYTDTANYTVLYTDSTNHVNFSNYDLRSVDLTPYAGQSIHVAFHNHAWHLAPSATELYIDNVEIRSSQVPVVSLSAPSATNSHTTVTFTATLVEGSSTGLTYTWHSTLMDSTMVTTAPVLTMAYTLGGTDIMMVIASNAYGADTATATVSVTDCTPIATLPWEEDFNNVAAVARNAANGKVPNCWNRYWSGSDAKYTPHVISNYPYNPISGYFSSSNRALLLQAGTTAGYDSVAMVESPAFDVPLNGQLLSFYYMHESASSGTLSVGYLQDGSFVGVADMEPQAVGRTDTVSLQAIPAEVNRFALQWKKTGTWYGVIVDDLRVFARDTLPTVRIEDPTQIFVGDPTTFRAVLYNGLTDGLTYTWHSSLTGATWNGAHEWNVTYNVGGYDTVSVIAANAYGADTAQAVVYVDSHPLPLATLTAPTSVYVGDSVTVTATINDCSQNGLAFSWHSSMLDTTITLNSSFITLNYTAGGTDTVTFIVSNAYGADTVEAYIYVVDCNGATVPYVETFEGVTPTAYNIIGEGHLPLCWEAAYNGTNANIILPKVVNSYQFITGLPDNALLLIAGGGSTHSSWVQAMLPTFSLPLSSLVMSLDYRYESANAGTLTVGYVDDTLGFFPVKTLTPHAGSYTRDTVHFAGNVASYNGRIALRFAYNTSFYGVVVDNIEVISGNGIPTPLALTVDSVSASCASFSWLPVDSATAYVVSIEGVVDTVVADTAVVLCGLQTQTQYIARVADINGADTGLYATVQFTTPCVIADLPWFEDFQDSSPLACWSKRGIGYYGMQICTEYYWEDYCHSGSRGLQMYNYTAGNTLVVSTPVIEAPADELLVSFWVCNPNQVGGLLEAGVITDPTDSTTFVPLMQCTMTETPTRYEFDTRNAGVSGTAALAFRTTAYCTAMIVDDINVEQISSCARLRSVGSYALDARTAVVEWQYDTASVIPNTGVLITITDLTDSSIAPFVTDATGNSYTFGNLTLGHRYLASVQALCTDDTSVALTTEVVPTGNPCAEVTGPYNSGWFLMNCDRPYSYSQSLYPAVLAASVDTLFGIAYHLTSSSVEQYPTSYNTYSSGPRLVDVYIGQTSNTTLTAPVSATYLTLAVQNYELQVSDTGWVHINFTTPVPLDGVSNLIVTLDDNTGAIYGDVEFGHHTSDIGTCFRTSTSSYSYTQTYDPYNPAGFNPMAGTQIPDIQLLGGCSSDRCLQPIATVTDESEQSVSLGWYQRGNETQWQVEYHIDGDSTWTVAGITNDTVYTVVGLNAATGYRLRVVSICTDTVYGDILSAHTQCGTVSLPYHQTFRNYDMPNNQSHISEGGIPCWQTGNITLLSQGRGLWNTHQNGDFIISPEIGSDLSLVRVTLSASGSTFFNAGIKVGVCDSTGGNLVWLDTITLSDNAQDYIVHLNNYTGSNHHLAIGGSYRSWYLYDVLLEEAANCLPVHHIALSNLDDESISFCWPPIDASHRWAIYLDGTLIATTSDTSYALSGLMSNTEYHLGVREICGVGDTSVFTTLAVTTLCSTSLPYGEDFESYAHNSLPDCWYLDERPHTGSSHNAWILSNASTDGELRMGDYYSPYEVEDTLPNYICSPMLQVGNHSVSISVVVSGVTINWGSCQVGIMTNAADTDSFIALATITHTITDTLYQLSTIGMTLPAKYALAFRWYGYTYCSVDDINVTIVPSYTINLAVNDSAMGSVSGAGTYEEGSNVTIAATPNEGYHFVMWNDNVAESVRTVKVETDTLFTAFFAPDQHTVTVASSDEGACRTYGSGTYDYGDTIEIGYVALDTVPQGGRWQFLGWSDGENDNPRTILVTSDTVIVALFEWMADSVGIGELVDNSYEIIVYPNPAHGAVTVEVSNPATLTVLDLTGRVVVAPQLLSSSATLPLTDLPSGTYFLRVTTAEGTAVKKLIVK